MRKWGRITTIGMLSTATAVVGLSAPADAADPVRTVEVSKDESIVHVEGLTPGDPISFEVRRNGVQVGSATGIVPASGVYLLNHEIDPLLDPVLDPVVDPVIEPPLDDDTGVDEVDEPEGTALCWTGTTPHILGGDVVSVTSGGFTDEISVTDIDVTLEPTKIDSNTAIVRGRIAANPLPPIDQLSVTTSGRTASDVRFDGVAPGTSEGVIGRLRYISGGRFQATFNGLSAAQMGAFLDSEKVEATHVSAETATASHSTTATYGADARFTEDLCPPVSRQGITGTNLGVINRANLGRQLKVWGVSAYASTVRAIVTDRNGETRSVPATVAGTGTGQTWAATFPEWRMRGLADGALRLGAKYYDGSVALAGADRMIHKDTSAPARPRVLTRDRTFRNRTTVRLRAPGAQEIWFTINGRRPGPRTFGAAEYHGRFTLRRSRTVRAIAFDAAGNPSPVTRVSFRRIWR